jgi:hypothetical protein
MPLLQGGIVIWAGSTLDIPSGWQLCNGTNGTLDLRNRFIVGAGDSFSVGDVGGSANTILPLHSHGGSTNTVANHTHISAGGGSIGGGSLGIQSSGGSSSGSSGTSSSGAHNHTMVVSTAGVGENGIGKNLPPYYALCYIQQL